MKKLAVGAVCVALYACLSNTAFAVDFGRTTGSFNVSGGSAAYTIPVWTPPGPNGVTPNIALSYSSSASNGLGGVGWHLSAVTSIQRCNRTKSQDGGGAPVTLTLNDRFCIGGNRLRLFSGTYGNASSVYFTEISDYSRITAYGTAGNGPQYFVVEAKSGLKFEYGATTTSRVVLGTTVLRWMLNKVYDRNGNNYIVSYNNSNGFAVPDVISWTPVSWDLRPIATKRSSTIRTPALTRTRTSGKSPVTTSRTDTVSRPSRSRARERWCESTSSVTTRR